MAHPAVPHPTRIDFYMALSNHIAPGVIERGPGACLFANRLQSDTQKAAMNPAFRNKVRSTDVNAITSTIEHALVSAGLATDRGPLQNVTETIRRALSSAGQDQQLPAAADAPGCSADTATAEPALRLGTSDRRLVAGQFVTRQFRNQAGVRFYKLFVPTSYSTPMPLIVMLHGCTQSADDFAAGTQMNRLAQAQGFIVVYPEQAAKANGSRCWNWFKAQDQVRDHGEPSLIAGITREIATHYPVDSRRIYVAGLSAGAAMAVILGQTYPELFAAVGAHSGLPYAAAHDVPSAFAAMAAGLACGPAPSQPPGAAPGARKKTVHFVPTIVFHGDEDRTVGQDNGAEIVRQATEASDRESGKDSLTPSMQHGVAKGGRRYSRTVYCDVQGRSRVESWTLHGAGHAWAGGHASGSYTDATGPDASAEMVRFFLSQLRDGSASTLAAAPTGEG